MKNKNAFWKSCCIFALIPVLLAGCVNQPAQPPAPNSMAAKLIFLAELPDINVNDLRMISVNNLLVVEAEMTNSDNNYNAIQYRFQWRDKNGMQVGNEENWKVLNFSPSQAQHIKGIATSKYAVDFKLELKNNN
jgi:uncharacterized protein YcfL